MGAPLNTGIENFEEVILGLSQGNRVKLLGWIAESLVEEELQKNDVAEVPPAESTPESNSVWPPKNLRIADSEKLSGQKAMVC